MKGEGKNLRAAGERFPVYGFSLAHYLKPGDWLVVTAAALVVAWLFASLWQGGPAKRAVIRAKGEVFAEVPLDRDRTLKVPGPLGESVIRIRAGQARVAADPGPRQYCVKQGWLTRAGDAAICLPNQVSLELTGSARKYDSLSY